MSLGHIQTRTLGFYARCNGNWHTFSSDPATKRVIKSLVRRKLLEVSPLSSDCARITHSGMFQAWRNRDCTVEELQSLKHN